MNERKEYERLEMEVIEFENEDIITTSPGTDDDETEITSG